MRLRSRINTTMPATPAEKRAAIRIPVTVNHCVGSVRKSITPATSWARKGRFPFVGFHQFLKPVTIGS